MLGGNTRCQSACEEKLARRAEYRLGRLILQPREAREIAARVTPAQSLERCGHDSR